MRLLVAPLSHATQPTSGWCSLRNSLFFVTPPSLRKPPSLACSLPRSRNNVLFASDLTKMPRCTFFKSAVAAAAIAATASPAVSTATSTTFPHIPIYDASAYTTVLNSTDNGELQLVSVPGSDGTSPAQELRVLHVYGSPREMGRAHGLLLGDFAATFLNEKVPEFFEQEFESVLPPGLPDWLVKLFDEAVASKAPEVFNIALEYVYGVQKSYLEASPTHVLDELAGMAEGLCASGAPFGTTHTNADGSPSSSSCDVDKLTGRLIRVNLLPELIQMSCSIVGATGKATPSGGLNQLRALDFGSGPFANYSVVTVYHPDEGNDFASVGFAGFSNLVTGISEYIGLSEKVHMVYDNGTGLEPGTYKGRAVATVMREMLQFTNSTAQAIDYVRNQNRTWSVFLGTGDTGNNFEVLQYRHKSVDVFDWRNISNVTESVPIEDITYVDLHPQPTHDPDMMPTILKSNYGNLSIETFAQLPQQLGATGDVHIAVYDYPNQKMLVSVGTVDAEGNYGDNDEGKACHRPFLRFDLKELWDHRPAAAPQNRFVGV